VQNPAYSLQKTLIGYSGAASTLQFCCIV